MPEYRQRSRSRDRHRKYSRDYSRNDDGRRRDSYRERDGRSPVRRSEDRRERSEQDEDKAKKAARLAKFAVWKAKQAIVSSEEKGNGNVASVKNAANASTEINEDPLDAFMSAEVLPEVQAKEMEEKKRAEEESKKIKEMLSVRHGFGQWQCLSFV